MGKGYMLCRWLIVVMLLAVSTPAYGSEAVDRAKAELERGRYAQAAQLLHEQVRQDNRNYQLWFLLGVAYAQQQQFHQAVEAFRQVIELNPQLAEPHNNLAVIYNELGDVHAAVDELEMSLQKQPGYAVAEENLAELYLKLTLRYYKSALEKSPTPQLEQRYSRLLHVRDPLEGSLPATAVAEAPAAEERAMPVRVAAKAEGVPVADQLQVSETASVEPAVVEKAESFDEATVQAAVEAWRAAWSAQDLEGYFASYTGDFMVPARFRSLDEWKGYKRRVISGKKYIQVELRDIEVRFAPDRNRVIVRFNQSFHSDTYNGDDFKELELERQGQEWKIRREDSVS